LWLIVVPLPSGKNPFAVIIIIIYGLRLSVSVRVYFSLYIPRFVFPSLKSEGRAEGVVSEMDKLNTRLSVTVAAGKFSFLSTVFVRHVFEPV
jgi:hypothetical protein